jgi:hypothetical protein
MKRELLIAVLLAVGALALGYFLPEIIKLFKRKK